MEVDIARQVLFLVDAEGKVGNIVPISSGSGKRFKERGYPETEAITPWLAHTRDSSSIATTYET